MTPDELRVYLLGKREEYKRAYDKAANLASANLGALQAIDDALAKLSADVAIVDPPPPPEQV